MNEVNLNEESKTIVSSLVVDVFSAANLLHSDAENQFYRRTYIRSFFSFIEGFGVALRAGILNLPEASSLAPEKVCVLRDEKYEIEKNGKLKVVEARYPSLNLLAALLRCWSELKGMDETTITNRIFGVDGWRKFQKTLEVRHRLTHPKLVSGMEISEAEIQDGLDSFNWFLTLLIDLLGINLDKTALVNYTKSKMG